MSLKNTHKLPGAPKDKIRNITKFPVNGSEVVTNYLQKDVRPLFLKASFPVFLDFSEGSFQLESDDFLKSCTNVIKELNLTSNALIEINSLGHLNKLKKLIANKNNLVEISVAGLSSMVYLGLCNNRLDHFPDLTDQSKKLLNIDLSYNRLVDGFDQLGKLKVLKVLDLSNNNITMSLVDFQKKILEHLKKVKTLEYLSMENNPIEKSIDEFRLYISNELPKLKYYNWVIIGKEERTKAAKLESDAFWLKVQQQQQQQLKNSLGSSSGSIPIKPPSSPVGFLQRKPSMGIGMSPKFSSLNRSNDNFLSSSPSLSTPGSSLGSSNSDLSFKNMLSQSGNVDTTSPTKTEPISIQSITTTTTSSSTPATSPLKSSSSAIIGTPENSMKLKNMFSGLDEFGGSKRSSLSDSPSGSQISVSSSASTVTPSSSTTTVTTNTVTPNTNELSKEECEQYLDQLLNELPSVDHVIDFSTYKSFFDQKLFLDLLYRAITEDVIPNELFEINVKSTLPLVTIPVLLDDEELLEKPQEQPSITTVISTPTSPNSSFIEDTKQTTDSPKWTKSTEIPKPPVIEEKTPDLVVIPEETITTVTTSVKITANTQVRGSPIGSTQQPTVKPTDLNISNEPKQQPGYTPNIPKPLIVNKLKPVVKPVAQVKPVAEVKPVTQLKPVAEVKQPIVETVKVDVKPPVVETVKVEPPKPVEQPVKTVAKPTATGPKKDINVGEFDINQFNFEIEQTLADIESAYGFSGGDKVTETLKPTPVVEVKTEIPKVVAKPPPVVAKPVVEQPTKVQVKPIPQSVLSDITKLQDQSLAKQVENATSKLDEMIEAYNAKPSGDEDVLDKLITKFENDNKNNVITTNPPVNTRPSISQISATQNTSSTNLSRNLPTHGSSTQLAQPSQQQVASNIHSLSQLVVPHLDIKLGSKLGMGSFGDCFEGRIHGKHVILKKIRTQRFSDQFLNQFKEDVNQLKELQHENISPVIGCCLDSTIYIVSPYYEGMSLQQYLDNPNIQVTNEFILRVSYQISKAMVVLHQKDVIHRALKPNNVIIESQSGNAYVRDFAFTGMKDSIHRTGHTGNAYMAPELFSTSCNSYESPIDQFSFAMILLQLFTRQQPFATVTPNRLGDTIMNGTRPDIPDTVPSVFNRLIRACWNHDPSARPSFLTISKILSQPMARIFTGVPTASTLNMTASGATPSNTPSINNNPQATTGGITIVNNTAKHQFSETGDLKRKMSLVLEKIMSMLADPTLDVIKKALKALENLSSPENHSLMIGIGLLKHLVRLLSIGELQEQLLKLLYSLCTNESLSNEFIYSNGFEPLSKIMQIDNISTNLLSVKLLTIIADEQHLEQIRTSGILQALLKYLHSTNELLVMQVVGALSRVLLDYNIQTYFIESGSVAILLEMLSSGHAGLSMRSLLALCCLITNDKCKDELLHAGIIPKLMELLASPQKLLRLHTLKIVQTISKDAKFKDLLIRENCIKLLTDQLNNSSEDALPMILSCLSSILKEQISFNIFYASLGIDKLSLLINQSITKLTSMFMYHQPQQMQQQVQPTVEILSGALSVVYSVINHENSRNRLKPIIPRLVDVLQKSEQINSDFIVQILTCLTAFSNHVTCIEAIEQTMCIPNIVNLLRHSNNYEIKLYSLKFISTLVKMNPKFTQTILNSGVLQLFIDFIQDKSTTIKEESIATISWLTSSPECRMAFLQRGVLKQLIQFTSTKNNDCIERLLWAFSFFAMDEPAQAIMRESNVFDFIIKSLEREEEVFRTLAIKSVLILVQKQPNKETLKRFGAISYLKPLESSPNKSLQLASKKIISLLA
ncbi:leucine-rich repeat-containing protein (LRR) [Tieghemostelium lacteum]|uniref:Leucine-rich repeat-containing protein (LRR) n=1 Tax=Tieghemostelium lacteum TaxID=361077 RepID=A0A151ZB83_TIELA|nr:leucine-rich repeat-containing protein (LRR) [Tieghemostelium lacteum]|eukprot:KYQ91144.1 leucine-rich repeat-containing protein (LRR) [Tieghemostelium lacteum]